MSRFVFLGSAAALGIVAAGIISQYAPDRAADPQPWSVATPLPWASPTEWLPGRPATQPPSQQGGDPDGHGVPVGPYAVAGLAVLVAGAGAAVAAGRRRRRGEPSVELVLQEHWYCVLHAEHPDGTREELRRGLLHWPAPNTAAVEAEVIARHQARCGTVAGVTLRCAAAPASQWAIYAGSRIVDRGPVALDDATTVEGMAVELLDAYAQRNNLSLDEVRRLRCAIWGPDGYGEADGRDW